MSESLQRVRLESGWKHALANEFLAPYMHELRGFLDAEKKAGKEVYPPTRITDRTRPMACVFRCVVVFSHHRP